MQKRYDKSGEIIDYRGQVIYKCKDQGKKHFLGSLGDYVDGSIFLSFSFLIPIISR